MWLLVATGSTGSAASSSTLLNGVTFVSAEQNNNDTRDDEEDEVDNIRSDDPYVYSDDSASFSDAYFCPQYPEDVLHVTVRKQQQ